jgi:hypothetical protein
MANKGAGLYITNSKVYMWRNKLIRNASIYEKTTEEEGNGGGIYFECLKLSTAEMRSCTDKCCLLLEKNKFDSNRAINKGGGIMWTDKNITVVPYSNWFTNNTANYADDIGSLPTNLETKFELPNEEKEYFLPETDLLDIIVD